MMVIYSFRCYGSMHEQKHDGEKMIVQLSRSLNHHIHVNICQTGTCLDAITGTSASKV